MVGRQGAALAAEDTAALKWVADSLDVLIRSSKGQERLTLRQALFFLAVASARQKGHSVDLNHVRERHPIGRSIEKSKNTLLEATPQNPDALGWLRQEEDPTDRRTRWFVVTDTGEAVLRTLPEKPRALTMAMVLQRLRAARGAQ
jgi:hypothetical protein